MLGCGGLYSYRIIYTVAQESSMVPEAPYFKGVGTVS